MHLETLNNTRNSQQNGVADRMDRTLMKNVFCTLSNSGLLEIFWAKVIAKNCFLIVIEKKTLEDF